MPLQRPDLTTETAEANRLFRPERIIGIPVVVITLLSISAISGNATLSGITFLVILVSVPVWLRAIRPTRSEATTAFLRRITENDHQSRHLRRALAPVTSNKETWWSKLRASLRREPHKLWRPNPMPEATPQSRNIKLDEDEEVIFELRRHLVSMFSPLPIVLLIGALSEPLGRVGKVSMAARTSRKSRAYLAAIAFGVILAVIFVITFRELLFWLALVSLVAYVSVSVRLWFVQTIAVTQKRAISFEGIRARPHIVMLSDQRQDVRAQPSTFARVLVFLGVITIPWGRLALWQRTVTITPAKGGGEAKVSTRTELASVILGVPGVQILANAGYFTLPEQPVLPPVPRAPN